MYLIDLKHLLVAFIAILSRWSIQAYVQRLKFQLAH